MHPSSRSKQPISITKRPSRLSVFPVGGNTPLGDVEEITFLDVCSSTTFCSFKHKVASRVVVHDGLNVVRSIPFFLPNRNDGASRPMSSEEQGCNST